MYTYGVPEITELVTGPGNQLPTLVLLHHRGARPEVFADMFSGLLDGLPPLRVLVPAGPFTSGSGYSWFPPDYYQDARSQALLLADGADQIALLLRSRQQEQQPVIVSGASQGGDLSFALRARHPEMVWASLPLLGNFPEELWPEQANGLGPVHAFHGKDDPNVPFHQAKRTVEGLRQAGLDVTMHAYPKVKHQFPALMAQDWQNVLGQVLDSWHAARADQEDALLASW